MANAVNQLLARLFQEPELLEKVRRDPQAVFREAGLSERERSALEEGSFEAMARIDVHPTLRMHFQIAVNPQITEHVTVKPFLAALEKERSRG